jgi:hypothetical protein
MLTVDQLYDNEDLLKQANDIVTKFSRFTFEKNNEVWKHPVLNTSHDKLIFYLDMGVLYEVIDQINEMLGPGLTKFGVEIYPDGAAIKLYSLNKMNNGFYQIQKDKNIIIFECFTPNRPTIFSIFLVVYLFAKDQLLQNRPDYEKEEDNNN